MRRGSGKRIVIVEPESGMRQILRAEVGEHLPIPIDAIDPSDLSNFTNVSNVKMLDSCLVVALPTRAEHVCLRRFPVP